MSESSLSLGEVRTPQISGNNSPSSSSSMYDRLDELQNQINTLNRKFELMRISISSIQMDIANMNTKIDTLGTNLNAKFDMLIGYLQRNVSSH